jgi:hypothetical protein
MTHAPHERVDMSDEHGHLIPVYDTPIQRDDEPTSEESAGSDEVTESATPDEGDTPAEEVSPS